MFARLKLVLVKGSRVRVPCGAPKCARKLSGDLRPVEIYAHNNQFFFIPTWSAGRSAAFDVTVTSPLQLSLLSRAAETPGASLEVAEDRKFLKHEKNCEEQGISFFPLAVETLGGWSALAIKTLKSNAILADARRSGSRDARVAPVRLLQSLSVCLMRGNATMIVSRAI